MKEDVYYIFVIVDYVKRAVQPGNCLFRSYHCRRFVCVCLSVSGLFPSKGSAADAEAAVYSGIYSDFDLGNH